MPSEMLSPEIAQRLHALRERFEAGWKAGSPPPMEELLAEMPEEGLPALLTELLRIECQYGTPGGSAEECRVRFPDPAPPAAPDPVLAVDSVFDDPLIDSTDTDNVVRPPHSPVLPSVPGYDVQEK